MIEFSINFLAVDFDHFPFDLPRDRNRSRQYLPVEHCQCGVSEGIAAELPNASN